MSTILVSEKEMKSVFKNVLIKYGFSLTKAEQCAEIFTDNTLDGITTHGVNRFPRFISYIKNGYVRKDAEPSLIGGFGSLEQWNGNLGWSAVQHIIEDYKQSLPDGNASIVYPGEGVLQKRKKHNEKGVHVLQNVWSEILSL